MQSHAWMRDRFRAQGCFSVFHQMGPQEAKDLEMLTCNVWTQSSSHTQLLSSQLSLKAGFSFQVKIGFLYSVSISWTNSTCILLQQHVKSLIQGVTVQRIQGSQLQLYISVLRLLSFYCWDKMPWRKTASGIWKKENGHSFRRHRVYPDGQGVAAGVWDWPGSQEG